MFIFLILPACFDKITINNKCFSSSLPSVEEVPSTSWQSEVHSNCWFTRYHPCKEQLHAV